MNEKTYKNIKRFLLLEKNVIKLDNTGLTKIFKETKEEFDNLNNDYEEKKLTPIEQIMDIILLTVKDIVYDSTFMDAVLLFNSQVKIGKYRVDFCCELKDFNQKYIIECDGHNFHEKNKEQVKYDKQRERFLVNSGYKVLRYSGSEIMNDFLTIRSELINFFIKEYKQENRGK